MYIVMEKTVFWIRHKTGRGGFASSPDKLENGLSKITTI